jgi:hypothetical protein
LLHWVCRALLGIIFACFDGRAQENSMPKIASGANQLLRHCLARLVHCANEPIRFRRFPKSNPEDDCQLAIENLLFVIAERGPDLGLLNNQ